MHWHSINERMPEPTALRKGHLVLWDGERIMEGGWTGMEWYDNEVGYVVGVIEWAEKLPGDNGKSRS